MPADPAWSWRHELNRRKDAVALLVGPVILGGGGLFGGLLAEEPRSAAPWHAMLGGIVLGLLLGIPTVLLGRRLDSRTWAALSRDGRLIFHAGRQHDELDLRAQPTVHAVHLVQEIPAPGRTWRLDYTLVGAGSAARFEGVHGKAPSAKAAVVAGLRIPVEATPGLVEAMSKFAEVVELRGVIVQRKTRVTEGFPE